MISLITRYFNKLQINSSDDLSYPVDPLDRIVGQEEAKEALLKAIAYNRHVLMIGAPGIGKSALSKAISTRLPVSNQQLLSMPNYEDRANPILKVLPGSFDLAAYKKLQASKDTPRYTMTGTLSTVLYWIVVGALIITTAMTFTHYLAAEDPVTGVQLVKFAAVVLLHLARGLCSRENILLLLVIPIVTQILNGYNSYTVATTRVKNPMLEAVVVHQYNHPMVDATGSTLPQLVGTVLHDPYVGIFVHTNYDPTHKLVVPGAIHKAHNGILYIDEVGTMSSQVQYHLLTVLQQQSAPVSGATSFNGSNSHVKTNQIPCHFRLIMAGNYQTLKYIHKALRSRIKSYGSQIYMADKTPITMKHTRELLAYFKYQIQTHKYPAFDRPALEALLHYAARVSGRANHYTLRLRQFSAILRNAADHAVLYRKTTRSVTKTDVEVAIAHTKTLEEQAALNMTTNTRVAAPVIVYCQLKTDKRGETDVEGSQQFIPMVIGLDHAMPSTAMSAHRLHITNVGAALVDSSVEGNELAQLLVKFTIIQSDVLRSQVNHTVTLRDLDLTVLRPNYEALLFPLLMYAGGAVTDGTVYIGNVSMAGRIYGQSSLVPGLLLAMARGYHVCTTHAFKSVIGTYPDVTYGDHITDFLTVRPSGYLI